MRARLVSLLAAEGVAIDQFTSRVTAFNMLDQVLVRGVPAKLLRMAVLVMYELGSETETFEERVSVKDPSGTSVISSEASVILPGRVQGQMPNGHRSVHMLWGVPIDSVGDYRVTLERRTTGDWETVSWTPFTALVQEHMLLNPQSISLSAAVPVPPASTPPETK